MDPQELSSSTKIEAEKARGLSVLFDVCAEALLNEPTNRVLKDMRNVAQTLGDDRFDRFEPDASLTQRYYDRFFVPSARCNVPLHENNVLRAYADGSEITYGPNQGPLSDHVTRCYQTAGFDYHALTGFAPAVDTLRADSLASECAFVAYLYRRCSDVTGSQAADAQKAGHIAGLAQDFTKRHLAPFSKKAAELLAATEDDLYAELCSFVAECATASLA